MVTPIRLALAGLLLAGHVSAQSYLGGIRGAVRDADGIVPGAEVRLISEGTAVERATYSNEVGEYAFADVPPGIYTLQAALAGFKTFASQGIRVGTQDFLTLDLTLDVGGIQEVVRVESQFPVIDTTTASVGTLIDRHTLETLPNAGRNPFLLAAIAPNAIATGVPQLVRMQDQDSTAMVSLGGGGRRANSYLLDGVPISDIFNRAVLIPSLEAIEEVKIQVSTYDAELGRTGGGVFNATHKSGANAWRGSALILNRPGWGTTQQYFARKARQAKPDTYFDQWGGSFGGPLVRSRTFFWVSTEGYRTHTTSNQVLQLPTALERVGNFSQSIDAATGRPIVIYDPLTTRPDPSRPGQFIRDPFPGNAIPANRIDRVASTIAAGLPLPTAGRTASRSALPIADFTNQATTKIDHRAGARHTISGVFAWYHSNEPSPQLYGTPGDPGAIVRPRTVNVVAINHLAVPTDRAVVALRYGYLRFRDDLESLPTNPQTLGFAPDFAAAITGYPRLNVLGYGFGPLVNGGTHTKSNFASQSASASISRLTGRQTLKVGADYRFMALDAVAQDNANGTFIFNSGFTQGPDPNLSGATSGDAFASFLLGLPASGTFSIITPNRFYTHSISSFVQDDVRFRSNVSATIGLRYDLEPGLRERDNAFTVGFDRRVAFPVQVPGLDLRGGLMFAGVENYPTHQGHPSSRNFGPRAGLAWSLGSRTVVRGGYGLFWSPLQVPQALNEAALGTRGFSATTTYVASQDGGLRPCPGCSLSNPFPGGLERPQGASAGLLTGVGGDISFVDQSSGPARSHQYSVDLQHEMGGKLAVSAAFVGSRSDHLTIGGTVAAPVNINQLDPKYLALGSGLLESVPNPFFGRPVFGALAQSMTIDRGRLLRPYPQFGNVFAHRVTASRARYDAVTFGAERRHYQGWSVRSNYTFSIRKDNQFAESNFFSGNFQSAAVDNYDLEREFSQSLLDTPHRFNLSGTIDLPLGWSLSAIALYQSGFPTAVFQLNSNSGLLGSNQRPNQVSGVPPGRDGSADDNYDPNCTCVRWLNPAAWTAAAPFTFGNAPRVDTRVRSPRRRNVDLALQKSQSLRKARLALRVELINVLNDPAFNGPRVALGGNGFGTIGGVGGFPRTLQLMARMSW